MWFEKGDVNSDGTISAVEFKDWESRMRNCKDMLKVRNTSNIEL